MPVTHTSHPIIPQGVSILTSWLCLPQYLETYYYYPRQFFTNSHVSYFKKLASLFPCSCLQIFLLRSSRKVCSNVQFLISISCLKYFHYFYHLQEAKPSISKYCSGLQSHMSKFCLLLSLQELAYVTQQAVLCPLICTLVPVMWNVPPHHTHLTSQLKDCLCLSPSLTLSDNVSLNLNT